MPTVSNLLEAALALHRAGRLTEAERVYGQVLAAEPHNPNACHLLGVIASETGKPDVAIELIGRALKLRPEFAEAHFNLGRALQLHGRLDDAIVSYGRATQLKPDYVEAYRNLGLALQSRGMVADSIRSYRQAVTVRPDHAETHYGLGNALQAAGNFDEAIACYRRALELNPELADAHNNLGIVLERKGEIDEAMGCYRRATELAPDFVGAHWNLSLLLLLCGNFEEGWPEYEWRWKTGKIPPRHFSEPQWRGQPISGKTVLIHCEQGFGDTFQFIRYVPLVKELGANVVVECQRPLVNLLANFNGIDQLIPAGQELPRFDFHTPLMSLPGVFGTTLATIPAAAPYLFAASELITHWREKLRAVSGFRIGINWQGRLYGDDIVRRDIPLAHFLSLADLPGVRLISLQKGEQPNEAARSGDHMPIVQFGAEVDETRGAFMDTAAIMKNLDLVISSDTSVVHLAGALGVPVWAALPYAGDWRWLLHRSDSPWYPTVRLFRQKRAGDWEGVFEEIRAALMAKCESARV